MYVLKRLPLTTSAVALFGAYTVISVAVRKIKTYFTTKNTSAPEPYLLRDIQHEILNQFLEEFKEPPFYATRYNLFELLTVCKDWYKFISHHDIWNRFIEQKIHMNAERLQELGDKDSHIADPIQELLGTTGVFSPRIMYYLFEERIGHVYHGQKPRPTLVKITPDLKPIKNDRKLWTPWLSHNILKTPEIVFKWLYTSIRYPRWVFALLNDAYDEKRKYGIYVDHNNMRNMKKILKLLSIGLSLLPWVDNVIWNSKDIIREVISGKYYGLWMKAPWSLAAQIQTVSFLMWMQIYDDQYSSPHLIVLRGVLLLSTMLFMRAFLVSAALVAALAGLFLIAVRKRILNKIGNIGTIIFALTVFAPLMYFYPVLTVLEAAAFGAVLMYWSQHSQRDFSDQKIKFSELFLALAIGTIGWAAAV